MIKFTPSSEPPRYGQRTCPKCGEWVSEIKTGSHAGRTYNDNGTWHEETCEPSAEYQEGERLRRAEWEAKNLINGDSRKEHRSKTPIMKKIKRTPMPDIK